MQGGGKNSCFGDSGGPIVKRIGNKHIQVGIDSWDSGWCGAAKYPAVYTRVSGVYNWITSVVCDRWQSDGPLCGDGGSSNSGNNNTGGGGNNGSSGPGDGDGTGNDDVPGDDDDGDDDSPNAGNDDNHGKHDDDDGYDDDDGPNDGDDDALGNDDDDDGHDDDDGPNAGDDDAHGYDDDDGGYDDDDGPNAGDDYGPGNDDDGDGGNYPNGGSNNDGSDSSKCIPVNLELQTDKYGDETEIFLLTDEGNLIWEERGFGNNTLKKFYTCLNRNGCAAINILDSYGDGILAPGKVKLTVDGTMKYNGGNFGDGIVFRIGNDC